MHVVFDNSSSVVIYNINLGMRQKFTSNIIKTIKSFILNIFEYVTTLLNPIDLIE